VNDRDRLWTLVAVGSLSVGIAVTDAIYRYLRPAMRPWLLGAGVCLVAIGLAGLWMQRHDGTEHDEHRHVGRRVGWLLLVPVVVALVFDPGALGSYAVGQQASASFNDVDFDLADHLRSHTFGGQAADLQLCEFVWSASDPADRRLLASTHVRLIGFVTRLEGAGPLYLARLRMGCCAGDAVASLVELRGAEPRPADDTWVEVVGTFDRQASAASDDPTRPVIRVERMRRIREPSEPYEYFR
jgi:uncharacterized repeat protein (TIGR03943 family)